jgi:hypothetical protein
MRMMSRAKVGSASVSCPRYLRPGLITKTTCYLYSIRTVEPTAIRALNPDFCLSNVDVSSSVDVFEIGVDELGTCFGY